MVYVTQLIHVFDGKEGVFHEFEQHALSLLKRHKGRLLLRCRPNESSWIRGDLEKPYEMHFISFESEMHFDAYLNDTDRKAFLHLKKESVKSSLTVKGMEL